MLKKKKGIKTGDEETQLKFYNIMVIYFIRLLGTVFSTIF